MTTPPAPGETCGCCTFGNHTEPCTCDGSNCCHPEKHRPAPPVPGLRDQIAGALLARIKQAVIIDPGPFSGMVGQPFAATEYDLADAVLAVVQPVIDEVDVLRRGALERSALLEEARDALSAAGQNGAHGDDWPNITPGIRALAERAADLATRATQQAELLEIAEHAGNTSEAARAEAATVLREVLAQFTQHGHPGAPCLRTPWIRTPTIERWRTALTPPVPADQPNT